MRNFLSYFLRVKKALFHAWVEKQYIVQLESEGDVLARVGVEGTDGARDVN